jgi:putative CocE/NonD family hydrolase
VIIDRDAKLKIVTEFPHEVCVHEHVWIRMPDGVRLSARIWLPADAELHPVPAILEYIPYRKRDGTRAWDDPRHHWWAGHGYAAIRLDIRGTGESEGIIVDEYTPQEQDDAVAAIAWIAQQAWCNGNVGMTGISWGGFNSLQVAARRPPALKAIITHCSTDDRYADDVHYMGGCLLVENFLWGSSFFQFMARPGDPQIQGARWRDQWHQRLESWEPVASTVWLEHQRRDEYWKHGSICESYDDISCAVYAIGGWEDGYSNAVPRLLEKLSCPRKGLVGPWGHKYPSDGLPGPAIGWLQESLRWWDCWLKHGDQTIMDEPSYHVWMREPSIPKATVRHSTGRWIAEETWPSPRIKAKRFELLSDGDFARMRKPVETVGVAAGVWCPYGLGGTSPDLAFDQNEDDARSLALETEPLDATLEILGAPVVQLQLAVDRPRAFVAVRLVDVGPDGTAERVSYQVLNLKHRGDHEQLDDITPGEKMDLSVKLNDIAWSFPAGHRLRVSVSTNYWPLVWPSPEPVTATLTTCTIDLPVRPLDEVELNPFEEAEAAPLPPMTEIDPPTGTRHCHRNLESGEWITTVIEDSGTYRLEELDLELSDGTRSELSIVEGQPLSAIARWESHSHRKRHGWNIEVCSTMRVRATKDTFIVDTELKAFDEGDSVFERSWHHEIERDGV